MDPAKTTTQSGNVDLQKKTLLDSIEIAERLTSPVLQSSVSLSETLNHYLKSNFSVAKYL